MLSDLPHPVISQLVVKALIIVKMALAIILISLNTMQVNFESFSYIIPISLREVGKGGSSRPVFKVGGHNKGDGSRHCCCRESMITIKTEGRL